VALLLPEKQTARYEAADRPYFEQKFKELCPNVEIIYQNASEDANLQQTQAESALSNGAKVLVLDPVDGKAAKAIVDKAKSQNVPVISYDRLTQGNIDFYISFDNERVGQLQAQTLINKLKAMGTPTGPIVMINGSPKDNNALLFNKGAKETFQAAGVQIAKEDWAANWKPEEAQTLMDGFITALGPNGFVAVYAANDGTAGGAITSMKNAGIDPKTKPTTGQDAELAAIQRIISGEQFMTVYKAIRPEAETAAQLACDLAQGKQIDVASVTQGKTVKNDTKDVPSVLLTPVAVTADGSIEGTVSVKDSVIKDGFTDKTQLCSGDYKQYCDALGIQ
jgi:D-xylose transport system substrate-binding protein